MNDNVVEAKWTGVYRCPFCQENEDFQAGDPILHQCDQPGNNLALYFEAENNSGEGQIALIHDTSEYIIVSQRPKTNSQVNLVRGSTEGKAWESVFHIVSVQDSTEPQVDYVIEVVRVGEWRRFDPNLVSHWVYLIDDRDHRV